MTPTPATPARLPVRIGADPSGDPLGFATTPRGACTVVRRVAPCALRGGTPVADVVTPVEPVDAPRAPYWSVATVRGTA